MGLALGLLLWKGLEIGLSDGLRLRHGVVVKVGFAEGLLMRLSGRLG